MMIDGHKQEWPAVAPNNITVPEDQLAESVCVHRNVKHPRQSPADVEGPKPPQEVESALDPPVEGFSVFGPVQLIVYVHL